MKRFLLFTLLSALLVLTTGVMFAQDDGTATPTNLVGGQTVIGKDLIVEAGTTVDGDVIVWFGDLTLEGTVTGDVTVIGGDIIATEMTTVSGPCTSILGSSAEQLNTDCVVMATVPANVEAALQNNVAGIVRGESAENDQSTMRADAGVLPTLGFSLGQALLLAAITFAAASMAPQHVTRLSDAMRHKPIATATVGLLSGTAALTLIIGIVLVSALLIVVLVGLVGFPIAFVLTMLLAAAVLVGWIGASALVGNWLTETFNMTRMTARIAAAVGAFTLVMTLGLLAVLPLGGLVATMIQLAIGALGLGAVLLTRFGTRDYPEVSGAIKVGKEEIGRVF